MFSNIKVGDKVILLLGTWVNPTKRIMSPKICEVEKVNKVTFKVDDGPTLFNIKDGSQNKSSYNLVKVLPFTQETFDKYATIEKEYKTVQEAFRLMKSVSTLKYKQAVAIIEVLSSGGDK